MTTRRLAPAALLAALAGCVLSDSGDLTLLPEGTLPGGAWVALEVRGPVRRIALEIDGVRIPGTFPANAPLDVTLDPGLREGDHVLVARALDGSAPRSVERTLRIQRGRELVTSVEPPDRDYAATDPLTDTPLVVEVRFTRPLAAIRSVQDAAFAGQPTVITVLPDGHTLRAALAQSLDRLGEATLVVPPTVVDPPAHAGWTFRWTRLPGKASTFGWRTASQNTRGTVAVRLEPVSGDPPSYIELTSGARVIGRLTAAGGWALDWDTTTVPEGAYLLEAIPQGDSDLTIEGEAPLIQVDRTPAGLVSCADTTAACFLVRLDEEARVVSAAVTFGAETATVSHGSASSTAHQLCPAWSSDPAPLWRSQHLELEVEDGVGLRSTIACDRRPPIWIEPYAPVEGTFTELAVALWNECHATVPWYAEYPGVFAVRAGATDAGRLVRFQLRYDYATSSWAGWTSTTLSTVGAVAREPSGRTWIEAAPGEPGLVFTGATTYGPRNVDPGQDARRPFELLGWGTVAWSEAAEGGGRVIRVPYFPFDPPPPIAGRSADEPALSRWTVGANTAEELDWLYAVWLESAPGEPRRLAAARARLRSPPLWEAIPTIAGLAAEASAPSIWGNAGQQFVAWTEAGRPLVSRSTDGVTFGPPVALGVDPSRAARGTVLDPVSPSPTVYWIERDTFGNDLLLSRRFVDGAWQLVTVPVNAGVPGEIRDLSVNSGWVGWLDSQGRAHLRRAACN